MCSTDFFMTEIMRRIIQTGGWFILAAILSSCALATNIAPTQSATMATIPQIPSNSTLTITPSYFPPIANNPHQQVYIDPDGWFSINIPAEWKPKGVNLFSGEDGFFETRYLPEMMFMQHATDVCQWLANIVTKSMYFISLNDKPSGCKLTTLQGITPAAVEAIIENPQEDYAYRFFYIKADAEYFAKKISTFAWLRSVDLNREPSYHLMPLRPEDASFWENTAPLPSKFSVTEYILPSEAQNESPANTIFLKYIPTNVPPLDQKTKNYTGTPQNKFNILTSMNS